MPFNSEIKNFRLSRLMNQTEFGEALGVSFTTVNRWENGKARPNLKAMKALNKLIAPPLKKENEDGTGNHGGEDSLDLRLGSEYQLGGAIFAKLEKYVKNSEGELHDADRDEFEKLWSFHIKNILSEYLRGRSNREILLCELEQKYYAAIKGEPPKKTASPNGESVTDDPNPATGSEPQD